MSPATPAIYLDVLRGKRPGYSVSVTSGVVTVAGDTATIDFALSEAPGPRHYLVGFTMVGLRTATSCSIALDGSGLTSSSASVNFTVAVGYLGAEVGSVTGCSANPNTGFVDLNGDPESGAISFTPAPTNATCSGRFLGPPLLERGTLWPAGSPIS